MTTDTPQTSKEYLNNLTGRDKHTYDGALRYLNIARAVAHEVMDPEVTPAVVLQAMALAFACPPESF